LLNQEKRVNERRFKASEKREWYNRSTKNMDNKLTKNVGRPTKYIPEIIHPKINEYLSQCGKEQTQLPSVEGLAIYLNVNRDSVFEWAKRYPQFSDYLKRIADLQKEQLMNDGMYGGKEVNASMAIFLLKAIHGLKDGDGTTNIQVNVIPILGKEAVLNVPTDDRDGQDITVNKED
jgi:hypothetical protein